MCGRLCVCVCAQDEIQDCHVGAYEQVLSAPV